MMRTPLDKSLRPIPRTLSEANRDAEYCMAIQTFKSDAKLTLDFIWNALIGFATVGIIGLICYLIVTMV
jgi:ABC-type tungstate transport system substrate-binding protein